MTTELSGGLPADRDGVLLDPPADPRVGENHAFWLFDDAGDYALLCAHVQVPGPAPDRNDSRLPAGDAAPADWNLRRLAYAFVLPDGRVVTDWQVAGQSTSDEVRVGDTSFRREEPFVRWVAAIRGDAQVVTAADMMSRPVGDAPRTEFTLDAEMEMVRPPWVQGSLASDTPGKQEALQFIGGDRYEQLYKTRVSGRLGDDAFSFTGTGLRTHRVGPRAVTAMRGHSWCTAVFPSGRAFAYMAFPREDWSTSYLEGFVDEPNGRQPLVSADFPWLRLLEFSGERFQIVLRTAAGTEHIDGETLCHSTNMARGVTDPGNWAITHGMARFRWDGEETTGLIERSAPGERLSR